MRTQGLVLSDNGHIAVAPVSLVDESRYRNDLAFVNSPTMVQLESGLWVYRLDAGSSQNLNIVDNISLRANTHITLECWSNGAASAGYLMAKFGGAADEYFLQIKATEIRFHCYNLTDARIDYTYTKTAIWNHILGVYDGTKIYIYLDGVEGNSEISTGTITRSDGNFRIGRAGGVYFTGDIALPQIYNYALNPAQVRARYNSTRWWFGV